MLERKIEKLLLQCGMAPHLNGFQGCVQAIKLIINEPEVMKKVTTRIYPEVAKAIGTTNSAAERSIRFAIYSIFDHCNYEDIIELLGGLQVRIKKGVFTNSEFLSLCAMKIRNDLQGVA